MPMSTSNASGVMNGDGPGSRRPIGRGHQEWALTGSGRGDEMPVDGVDVNRSAGKCRLHRIQHETHTLRAWFGISARAPPSSSRRAASRRWRRSFPASPEEAAPARGGRVGSHAWAAQDGQDLPSWTCASLVLTPPISQPTVGTRTIYRKVDPPHTDSVGRIGHRVPGPGGPQSPELPRHRLVLCGSSRCRRADV